jgi:hypothetical protein
MKDILTALVTLYGDQALAVAAVSEQVSALRTTLLFHFPYIEDDLNVNVASEKEKNKEPVAQVQKTLAELQEVVSRLAN